LHAGTRQSIVIRRLNVRNLGQHGVERGPIATFRPFSKVVEGLERRDFPPTAELMI
jgi:hypothetical protein